MTRLSAQDRLRRILAIIPWVVDKGGADLSEIAERFDYAENMLLLDLENVVGLVGVAPFGPGDMIEVTVDDGFVEIGSADGFSRPLLLTPAELLELIAAGKSVAVLADQEQLGSLERGLTKMAVALGQGAQEAIDVRLGTGDGDVLGAFRRAGEKGQVLSIDYYSFGRNESQRRQVEPHRLFADKGHWYAEAFCQLRTEIRLFRLDRVRDFSKTDQTFTPVLDGAPIGEVFPVDEKMAEVVLRLAPAAQWVVGEYPHHEATEDDKGQWTVRLPVASPAWLARLLLRLGPQVEILEAPQELGEVLRSKAASRVLDRMTQERHLSGSSGD